MLEDDDWEIVDFFDVISVDLILVLEIILVKIEDLILIV